MLLRKRNNYMYTYLIVDDEMIERKGIRMLLSWMNIRENILEASNGEEALEVFEKEKIDVLLTDINMPFMDGIELLSRIHEEYPGTETVIFSGYDNYFEQVNSEQIEKMQSDLQMPRRRSQILGLEDGRSGLDLPGGQIGVRLLRGRGECVGGRGEGLDSPGGRIGVSLLTGAKFGDRMKKIFPEFFVLDFMRTEKFREDIV